MEDTSHPVRLEVEYPERLSRLHLLLKSFFGWFYVGIPHGIALTLYGFAAAIATVIAWFAILFTGRYPRSLFEFVTGYMRWTVRFQSYVMYYMVDKYPPFSGKP